MSSGWDPPQPPSVEGLPAYNPAPGMPAPPPLPLPPGMAPIQPPVPPVAPAGQPPVGPTGEYAGWWRRVGARLVDALLMIALLFLPFIAIAAAVPEDSNADLTDNQLLVVLVFGAIALAIWVLYAPVTMRKSGQTPGKAALGIRVVRDDGQPMTFGYAFVREVLVKGLLINTIGGFVFFPWLLNYLWPLWDESNRALHDQIVHSHVMMDTGSATTPPADVAPTPSAWGP